MRVRFVVLVAVVTAVLGAAATWAAMTLFKDTPREPTATYTLVTVGKGEVGSSIALNTVAAWSATGVGINRAVGVVTEVLVRPGASVKEGQVLYSVNLEPVVIGTGSIPSFRSLAEGATGQDVEQLQTFLAHVGHPTYDSSGTFAASTRSAVRSWQADVGATVDGIVEPGDIVFIPSRLPQTVSLDHGTIKVGASLAGGETVVSLLAQSPRFVLPVTDSQAAVMPAGTVVFIKAPSGGNWKARVASQEPNAATSQTDVVLRASSKGQPICRSACQSIPVLGQTSLESRVVTLRTTRGLVVPVAALLSDAEGVSVMKADGTVSPVTVVASSDGVAVVTGVAPGDRLRIEPKV